MIPNRKTRLRATAGVLCALMVLGLPGLVLAHLGSIKYIRAERTGVGATIEVDVERIDAAMELGLAEDSEDEPVAARFAQVQRWVGDGITLRSDGTECASEVGEPSFVDRENGRYVRMTIAYDCGGAEGALVLHDAIVFPDDEQHETFVQFAWGGDETAAIMRKGRQEVELSSPPSGFELFKTFLVEGVLHFALGFDHVLFLLSLVLAAGFVAARESFKAALRDVAILVTAFTLGHSVTLIAAALEWVVLPIQPVEIVIAASIVVVAVMNIAKPEQRGPLPWLALVFGLIHGFGFSSVLAEVGLPGTGRVVALLAFNLGIEVAQLAFVALVLGPIAWSAKSETIYPNIVRVGSGLIALLAMFWVVERIIG